MHYETPTEIPEMITIIHEAALNKKGEKPLALFVRELTSIADYFYIVSGWSERQVRALYQEIAERLREAGHKPIHVEGEETSHWILIDYGTVIVHIFLQETRDYYSLERLWADAPLCEISGQTEN